MPSVSSVDKLRALSGWCNERAGRSWAHEALASCVSQLLGLEERGLPVDVEIEGVGVLSDTVFFVLYRNLPRDDRLRGIRGHRLAPGESPDALSRLQETGYQDDPAIYGSYLSYYLDEPFADSEFSGPDELGICWFTPR